MEKVFIWLSIILSRIYLHGRSIDRWANRPHNSSQRMDDAGRCEGPR